MLFLPSLFQFFGFVCLLLFSCALSHSLINVDFLFHLLLRGPFSLKFHFFFVYFLHPSNSLFNLLSLLPCTCLGQLLLFSVLFPISQPAEKKKPKNSKRHPTNKNPKPWASYRSGTWGSWWSGHGCTYVNALTSHLSECNYRNPFCQPSKRTKSYALRNRLTRENQYIRGASPALLARAVTVSAFPL